MEIGACLLQDDCLASPMLSNQRMENPYQQQIFLCIHMYVMTPVSVAQWANPHEPQCATRPDWLATATGPGSTPGLGVSFSAKLD